MGNLKRHFEENAAYFITTTTKDRAPIFRDRKLCRILLVTIEYHKTVFDYRVYGYCIMPDHFHAILHPKGPFKLSYIMQMIKGSFSRKINKLKGTEGALWQKRFYDEIVHTERQLLNQLDYMHQNPVTDGLVKAAGDYPFSSFNQYRKRTDPENQLLQIDL